MELISRLEGPVVVVGASGFIGAYLLNDLLDKGADAYGVSRNTSNWRLVHVPSDRLIRGQAGDPSTIAKIKVLAPKTIFYLAANGAYAHQNDAASILNTNVIEFERFCSAFNDEAMPPVIVHAGSSSEYGLNSDAPSEDDLLSPNSLYSVSKGAAALLISYLGKMNHYPIANLRLYSVYGPFEDPGRLIPRIVSSGLKGTYPPLTNATVGRDFVYIADVVEAFYSTAVKLREVKALRGHSFNIGSGIETTIEEVALTAQKAFQISEEPEFGSHPGREWDVDKWRANVIKTNNALNWRARTSLENGIRKFAEWMQSNPDLSKSAVPLTDGKSLQNRNKISAIIACYKDDQAIPIMHQKLVEVFNKINVDYEVIFIDDCCPSGSAEAIRRVSEIDSNVIGISHSRNFGSQAAFMSGIKACTGDAAVLLDGDLQDPPHLIELFYKKWRSGTEVVYGVRVKREMGALTESMYKGFYWLFAKLTPFKVPKDAGDFSLIDRRVIEHLKNFNEKDLFLRGIRAYAGFAQDGVNYTRPDRMFGKSTNNLWKNIEWAKRGIFSFTVFPISLLSMITIIFGSLLTLFALFVVASKLFLPVYIPDGITTIILLILFVSTLQLFGISVIGEYIGKILNETKNRPLYIVASTIKHGKISKVDLE